MADPQDSSQQHQQADLIERMCEEFNAAWLSGTKPDLHACIGSVDAALRELLVIRLLPIDIQYRRQHRFPLSSEIYSGLGESAEKLVADLFASNDRTTSNGAAITESVNAQDTIALPAPATQQATDVDQTFDYANHVEPSSTAAELAADVTQDAATAGQPLVKLAIRGSTDEERQPASMSHRYRPVAMHAKGGLGAVYRAEDQELRRIVALKQILPQHRKNIDSRTRFLFEAEITGFLEHPGIVPVYGLGTDREGQPYYAMRFIQGQSFSAAISDFHSSIAASNTETLAAEPNKQEAGIDSKGKALDENHAQARANRADYLGREFRSLLKRMVDICNTLYYAHQQGVLHRDLKPDNVMLGSYGETLVVDWGLAKLLASRPDSNPEDSGAVDNAIKPSESALKTNLGAIVGTPLFMSPEQATGSELSVTADIYSLGAILFCIISGERPIAGQSIGEVMMNVRNGAIKDLSRICPSAPRPLISICRKAMHKNPADRYQSALELATEIERWLSDEPVLSHASAESIAEKAGRFIRRHRGWTTAIAVALMAITIVSIVATVFVSRARRNEQIARLQANQFKGEAIERYREAREAIDTWLVQSDEALQFFPGTQSLRERLLTVAAEDYAKLSLLRSDDPELELERVRVQIRLGDLSQLKEDLQTAIDYYETAIVSVEYFLANPSERIEPALLLRFKSEGARAKTRIAIALANLNEYDAAISNYQEAIDELQGLLSASQDSQASRYLADALVNVGELFAMLQRFDEGEQRFKIGLQLFERLSLEAVPDDVLNQAKTEELYSRLLSKTGRSAEAVGLLEMASGRLERLVSGNVDNPRYLDALASTLITKAGLLRKSGLEEEERQALEEAIGHYRSLVRALPDLPKYTEGLATSLTDLGLLELDRERGPDSDLALSEAAQLTTDLIRRYGNTSYYRFQLGTQYDALGQVRKLVNESEDAEQLLGAAHEVFEGLSAQYPERADYLERLAIVKSHLAQATPSNDDAEAGFTSAAEILTNLVREFPAVPAYAVALGHVHFQHGLKRHRTEHSAAASSFESAIRIWQTLGEARDPSTTERLAWLLATCPIEELRDLSVARLLAEKAVTATPESRMYRVTRALVELLSGDAVAARALLSEDLLNEKSGKSGLVGREYLLLSAIEQRAGNVEKAMELRQQGVDWMHANAPASDDLRFLLELPESDE